MQYWIYRLHRQCYQPGARPHVGVSATARAPTHTSSNTLYDLAPVTVYLYQYCSQKYSTFQYLPFNFLEEVTLFKKDKGKKPNLSYTWIINCRMGSQVVIHTISCLYRQTEMCCLSTVGLQKSRAPLRKHASYREPYWRYPRILFENVLLFYHGVWMLVYTVHSNFAKNVCSLFTFQQPERL